MPNINLPPAAPSSSISINIRLSDIAASPRPLPSLIDLIPYTCYWYLGGSLPYSGGATSLRLRASSSVSIPPCRSACASATCCVRALAWARSNASACAEWAAARAEGWYEGAVGE